MIALDEQQERVLADVAEIIGKSAAKSARRRLRRTAIFLLTLSRFLNRRKFEEWDRKRKEAAA
jgi:hypothetical protein